jgi:hypothetical protein
MELSPTDRVTKRLVFAFCPILSHSSFLPFFPLSRLIPYSFLSRILNLSLSLCTITALFRRQMRMRRRRVGGMEKTKRFAFYRRARSLGRRWRKRVRAGRAERLTVLGCLRRRPLPRPFHLLLFTWCFPFAHYGSRLLASEVQHSSNLSQSSPPLPCFSNNHLRSSSSSSNLKRLMSHSSPVLVLDNGAHSIKQAWASPSTSSPSVRLAHAPSPSPPPSLFAPLSHFPQTR